MLFAIFVETFQMGKIHKDIAMFMVEAAKNEEYNDQTLVKVRSNSELPPACLTWDEKDKNISIEQFGVRVSDHLFHCTFQVPGFLGCFGLFSECLGCFGVPGLLHARERWRLKPGSKLGFFLRVDET